MRRPPRARAARYRVTVKMRCVSGRQRKSGARAHQAVNPRWACALVLAAAALLGAAPSASADLPSLLSACGPRDALDDDNATRTLAYTFCDDGVPAAAGGATAQPHGPERD